MVCGTVLRTVLVLVVSVTDQANRIVIVGRFSVRLREGEVNGWKGERSQCIVTLVPMVLLAV